MAKNNKRPKNDYETVFVAKRKRGKGRKEEEEEEDAAYNIQHKHCIMFVQLVH